MRHLQIVRMLIVLVCVYGCSLVPAWANEMSATTYTDSAGNERPLVFYISNGRLMHKQFDGTGWTRVDHGVPPGNGKGAINRTISLHDPQAISYVEGGVRRIYAFVRRGVQSSPGTRLAVRYWDGVQWQWENQGGPSLNGALSVVTFRSDLGQQHIYVFSMSGGSNAPHHVVVNYWNGYQWQWSNLGAPREETGRNVQLFPTLWDGAAITYVTNSQRFIRVFAYSESPDPDPRQESHLLYSLTWNGSFWHWDDYVSGILGVPRGLSPVTYTDVRLARRIFIFETCCINIGVGATQWNGSSWQSVNFGISSIPPSGALNSGLSAVAYVRRPLIERIYAFAIDSDNALLALYWDGFSWNLADLGVPNGYGGVHSPHAITFSTSDASPTFPGGIQTQHVYVFAIGDNGNIVVDYSNNEGAWQWSDLGPR